MNIRKLIGIILIFAGIIGFVYQSITYTTREKIVEVDPVEVTAEEKKTISLPPIVGIVALVGGIVSLIIERKKD